jgi:hypothetical protein
MKIENEPIGVRGLVGNPLCWHAPGQNGLNGNAFRGFKELLGRAFRGYPLFSNGEARCE